MNEILRSLVSTRFEKILIPIEDRLRLKLDEVRQETDHAPTIGAKLETAVRETLRQFLPSSFGVGHGFVYDAYGDGSKQTDLIITNPDNPLSYPHDEAGTYIVDGVSAAGEVKAVLDVIGLDDCIRKGSAFKRLRMSFNVADGIHPAVMPYFNERGAVPPFLVIAFENKVAMSTLKDRLSSAPLVPVPKGKENDDGRGNNPQPPIDAVCLLGRGIVWNIRPGDPTVMRRPDTGEPIYGWRALDTQAPLALTLAWLHMTMPRIQRGASVFVPYLTPYARQLAYMTSGSFDPPVEPEEKPEGDTDGEPLD